MGVSPDPLPPCPCCHPAPCSQKDILGHLEVPSLLEEPAQDGSSESPGALVLPQGDAAGRVWCHFTAAVVMTPAGGQGVSMGWEVSMADATLTLRLLQIWDFSLSNPAEFTVFVKHLQR